MKLSKLKINPNNPQKFNDLSKLENSIKEFPKMMQLRPLVYDPETMQVLGGNKRLICLQNLGHKEIPDTWVMSANELTEEEKHRFIIADNVGFGQWDWDILANEWDSVQLAEWGIDVWENEDDKITEGLIEDDEIPEVKESKVKRGDIWKLGEHRIMCGDSTSSDDVAKLMNGEKADMVFTDPPYNVAFNGRSGKFDVIKNDDLKDDDFNTFINEFANTLHTLDISIKYIWCNWKFYDVLKCKFNFNACIVWAKNVFGLGRGYRHQHEFCLFEGKLDDGINNESDLWNIAKDSKYVHPTQKPTALAERAFGNHKKALNVLDLFLGSGTTLIAAEKLNRKCYGMELDEKYCDVIIERWEQFTGQKAKKK
jgi:DNA modification methylase